MLGRSRDPAGGCERNASSRRTTAGPALAAPSSHCGSMIAGSSSRTRTPDVDTEATAGCTSTSVSVSTVLLSPLWLSLSAEDSVPAGMGGALEHAAMMAAARAAPSAASDSRVRPSSTGSAFSAASPGGPAATDGLCPGSSRPGGGPARNSGREGLFGASVVSTRKHGSATGRPVQLPDETSVLSTTPLGDSLIVDRLPLQTTAPPCGSICKLLEALRPVAMHAACAISGHRAGTDGCCGAGRCRLPGL
mmetsp:Transcript_15164/g.39013  ORF Transcript_15164/g.39013 Transcript_15164/m.39013 type:complete len:249 (+) Transcript_15164:362-1108(+)